jgi:hypothetical protein
MDPFKPYTPRIRLVAPKLDREGAEAVALRALSHVLSDTVLTDRFLQLTGCGPGEIRASATDPAFLGAVLDFLLADEASLLAFAESEGMAPETPALARSKLP